MDYILVFGSQKHQLSRVSITLVSSTALKICMYAKSLDLSKQNDLGLSKLKSWMFGLRLSRGLTSLDLRFRVSGFSRVWGNRQQREVLRNGVPCLDKAGGICL